ncbi:MAG: hypothetical protein AAFY15_14520 [Cyanobacteria bacterium J06648_11]
MQFIDTAAGPVVTRMIATLADIDARAVDDVKRNSYAAEILREKQQEQMKDSVTPDL